MKNRDIAPTTGAGKRQLASTQVQVSMELPIARKDPTKTWYLVTNQLNLTLMLSAGLIMSPKGFGEKYYQDPLAAFPGWIPLFAGKIPRAALESVTSENEPLAPVVACVALGGLRGRVLGLSQGGALREIDFPEGLVGAEVAILVRAPLPISWVETIVFPSKEAKEECERDTGVYPNVPLGDFKRDVDKRLFSSTSEGHWPPAHLPPNAPPASDLALDRTLAAGGIMAMLQHIGNRGDTAAIASGLAFEDKPHAPVFGKDSLIQYLPKWLANPQEIDAEDIQSRLFWGIVERIAQPASTTGGGPFFQDLVIEHLEASKDSLDEKLKAPLDALIRDLEALSRLSGKTASELFEQHKKPLSRALILFFLREKCGELLAYKHPALNESDTIAAAIFFAAREKWIGLPIALRGKPELAKAISQRMALLAQRWLDTGMDLGATPAHDAPLRALFLPGAKGWIARQRKAALELARALKWDCIYTKISLGAGDYTFNIDRGVMHIHLPGEAKAVLVDVQRDTFFDLMAKAEIPGKLEQKVRNILKARGTSDEDDPE